VNRPKSTYFRLYVPIRKGTANEDIVGLQTVIGAGKGDRKKGKQDTTIQRRCFYHSTSADIKVAIIFSIWRSTIAFNCDPSSVNAFITDVTLRSKVVRPSSICFSFVRRCFYHSTSADIK
jgi:hypothetical protein